MSSHPLLQQRCILCRLRPWRMFGDQCTGGSRVPPRPPPSRSQPRVSWPGVLLPLLYPDILSLGRDNARVSTHTVLYHRQLSMIYINASRLVGCRQALCSTNAQPKSGGLNRSSVIYTHNSRRVERTRSNRVAREDGVAGSWSTEHRGHAWDCERDTVKVCVSGV